MKYNDILTVRRSIYELENRLPVSENTVIGIIGDCVNFTPSAYNAQSQRVVLLLGENHRKLWRDTSEYLTSTLPMDRIDRVKKRMDNFIDAYGTVLFFDDSTVTRELIKKFPASEKNFLTWAEQQNGMLQVNVWNSLAAMEIGANLQHYNEAVEKMLGTIMDIPQSWRLVAQMPFGAIKNRPDPKDKVPLTERFLIK